MKKLLTTTLASLILFAGCQSAQPAEEDKDPNRQGSLLIHQVNEDGTKEEIGQINLTPKGQANVSIVPNVKGIIINEDGFSITAMSIEAGTKVIFQNTGEEEHWIKSDDCSGINDESPLQPTETLEYVFSEAGTCAFYDGNNEEFTGVIEVTAVEGAEEEGSEETDPEETPQEDESESMEE